MSNKIVINATTKVVSTETWNTDDQAVLDTAKNNTDNSFSVRQRRNELLNQSDWTQAADIPADTKSKWTTYRQNLRDVPTQSGFPNSVTWPTKPT